MVEEVVFFRHIAKLGPEPVEGPPKGETEAAK